MARTDCLATYPEGDFVYRLLGVVQHDDSSNLEEGQEHMMEEVESLAQEIATHISAKTLGQVRGSGNSVLLNKIFAVANIVRFYRMGCNPERWLGQTEELLIAKAFLGMPTIEEQKQILKERGYIREPGDDTGNE